jgi:hypothetical protein
LLPVLQDNAILHLLAPWRVMVVWSSAFAIAPHHGRLGQSGRASLAGLHETASIGIISSNIDPTIGVFFAHASASVVHLTVIVLHLPSNE